jgi:acyl carrier protein
MDKFKAQMAEILEVDDFNLSDELKSFECWDSLTILSIIAFAGDSYNVALSANDVVGSKTVGGLYELINSKK